MGTAVTSPPGQIVIASLGNPITVTETPPANFALNSASCVDANGASDGNGTGAIGSLSGTTLTIPAANAVAGAAFNCTFTNSFGNAVLKITKAASVVSDPINGAVNPKAIPGAVIKYTITVSNTGIGPVDSNAVVITDALPATTSLYVAGSPVTFADGSPSSGLSYSSAASTYSVAAGGGSPYTYTPVADANGYDANVTGLRIAPTGTMLAQSSFSVSYLVTLK